MYTIQDRYQLKFLIWVCYLLNSRENIVSGELSCGFGANYVSNMVKLKQDCHWNSMFLMEIKHKQCKRDYLPVLRKQNKDLLFNNVTS